MRYAVVVLASAWLLAATALSPETIKDGRLQAISSAGIAEAGIDFPASFEAPRTLSLTSTSTLKLSFTAASADSQDIGYAALILSTLSPRSLSLALHTPYNTSASNLFRRANSQVGSVSVYLTPKKGGKYRWEWDLATTSREDVLALARLSQGHVKAQIQLVSTKQSDAPLLLDIGHIAFRDESYYKTPKAMKWPREWEMERYSVRPELSWTFQEPRKPVHSVKALFGLGAVLAPWTILLGLLPYVLPSLTFAPSASTYAFLGSLLILESSTVAYWVGLITVWKFMPFVGVGALLSLLTGQRALGERMKLRLQSQGGEKVVTMG